MNKVRILLLVLMIAFFSLVPQGNNDNNTYLDFEDSEDIEFIEV